jgi:predicted AlkP superfamily pyrophosphatase or phosphodiesterase
LIIKSLLSGIIPEFADILWNFNTTYLVEDNILNQFKKENRSIVFYGDDTWLKLFNAEQYFTRYDGTSSFIASDYDEVDQNVTRHLDGEFTRNDWSIMILHYLGLDHVGHIEGPFAPLNIKRKLFEMDEIVKKIYSNLNKNDLFVLLSDHGMANQGGHGGSSHMETMTPILLITKENELKKGQDFIKDWYKFVDSIKHFEQIDLVSTISCLFDIKIPFHNRGVTFIAHLRGYDDLVEKFLFNFNQNFIDVSLWKNRIKIEIKIFQCLNRNFEQLYTAYSDELNNKADMISRIKYYNDLFFTELNDLNESQTVVTNLKEINDEMEVYLRNETSCLQIESNSLNQIYTMILAIVLMLNVNFVYFNFFLLYYVR